MSIFSPLSFEVLGQVSPVLSWIEGEHGGRLPATWATESTPFETRERGWLLHELPTYSYDNVDDIVRGARSKHYTQKPTDLPFMEDRRRPRLSPPADYDLLETFRHLNRYFLVWNGTEPCVREGRMEELHELAIRLPAGHVVRHGHARAVSEGAITFEEALKLPELVSLLPSNSFGLRSVVRQGLSESHLHLTAVTSAEETWADNLLRPLSARSIRGRTREEKRLLVLSLFAGRLLALAVWMSLLDPDKRLPVEPRRLLRHLDEVYFARTSYQEYRATEALERKIRHAVYGPDAEARRHSAESERSELQARKRSPESEGRRDSALSEPLTASVPGLCQEAALINQPVRETYRFLRPFLLRWMAPTAFHLRILSQGGPLREAAVEGLQERYAFVRQLHLAAHLRLVQLTPKKPPETERRKSEPSAEQPQVDPRRHFLHEALFRYLVCRTHHWQLATQQSRTTGLRHFKEYFDSGHRRPGGLSDQQYAELVFRRLRQWHGLRVLEGRVSPPKRPQELVPWILAHARPEDRRIEKFGLVVHFKKEEEGKEERGISKESPASRLRWGKRRRLVRNEGMRLYRLLRQPTPVTPFVVGIDACNLELATPPEVFAPVFRFLRELPISLHGTRYYTPYFGLEGAIRNLVEKRRLGMTYHVGEDFRHLLSGLRAICEVMDFLAPSPGDRLGHGTALALQPKDWLEHNGYQAVVSKLEWLDTLVWVHHFLGPGDDVVGELAIEDLIQRYSWYIYNISVAADYDPLGLDSSREEKVFDSLNRPLRDLTERDVRKLVSKGGLAWDRNWSPLTLWDAWRLRQLDPYSLNLRSLLLGELELKPSRGVSEEDRRWHTVQEQVMREVREDVGSRNAYLLLALYWMDPGVKKRGEEVVVVNMQENRVQWLELCRRVEEKMKRKVHERELVVEVNPSSNRIIGPMIRYGQHHVFHLTLDEEKRLSRQVRVSINTDNPAVCNTTLAHEHYLLGEILMAQDVPEAEVVKWLEWLRHNGTEYNFARRLRTVDESSDMRKLVEWLKNIRPTVREAHTRSEKHTAFWRWMRETWLRGQGFAPETISNAPAELERLVALERRLFSLR